MTNYFLMLIDGSYFFFVSFSVLRRCYGVAAVSWGPGGTNKPTGSFTNIGKWEAHTESKSMQSTLYTATVSWLHSNYVQHPGDWNCRFFLFAVEKFCYYTVVLSARWLSPVHRFSWFCALPQRQSSKHMSYTRIWSDFAKRRLQSIFIH